jgi:hypothetical protein
MKEKNASIQQNQCNDMLFTKTAVVECSTVHVCVVISLYMMIIPFQGKSGAFDDLIPSDQKI